MMDRASGKTLSDRCFVEFANIHELRSALSVRTPMFLRGRIVRMVESSPAVLFHATFPNHNALLPGGPFITRDEINSLLVICKSYKLHGSRKCPERPFENILSIVSKCPWHQPHLITTMHRDHIYEMLKLAIGMFQVFFPQTLSCCVLNCI